MLDAYCFMIKKERLICFRQIKGKILPLFKDTNLKRKYFKK